MQQLAALELPWGGMQATCSLIFQRMRLPAVGITELMLRINQDEANAGIEIFIRGRCTLPAEERQMIQPVFIGDEGSNYDQ